jgi:hypothetical protein
MSPLSSIPRRSAQHHSRNIAMALIDQLLTGQSSVANGAGDLSFY